MDELKWLKSYNRVNVCRGANGDKTLKGPNMVINGNKRMINMAKVGDLYNRYYTEW